MQANVFNIFEIFGITLTLKRKKINVPFLLLQTYVISARGFFSIFFLFSFFNNSCLMLMVFFDGLQTAEKLDTPEASSSIPLLIKQPPCRQRKKSKKKTKNNAPPPLSFAPSLSVRQHRHRAFFLRTLCGVRNMCCGPRAPHVRTHERHMKTQNLKRRSMSPAARRRSSSSGGECR